MGYHVISESNLLKQISPDKNDTYEIHFIGNPWYSAPQLVRIVFSSRNPDSDLNSILKKIKDLDYLSKLVIANEVGSTFWKKIDITSNNFWSENSNDTGSSFWVRSAKIYTVDTKNGLDRRKLLEVVTIAILAFLGLKLIMPIFQTYFLYLFLAIIGITSVLIFIKNINETNLKTYNIQVKPLDYEVGQYDQKYVDPEYVHYFLLSDIKSEIQVIESKYDYTNKLFKLKIVAPNTFTTSQVKNYILSDFKKIFSYFLHKTNEHPLICKFTSSEFTIDFL